MQDGWQLIVVEEIEHGMLEGWGGRRSQRQGQEPVEPYLATPGAGMLTWVKSQEVSRARLLYCPLKR